MSASLLEGQGRLMDKPCHYPLRDFCFDRSIGAPMVDMLIELVPKSPQGIMVLMKGFWELKGWGTGATIQYDRILSQVIHEPGCNLVPYM